MQSKRAVIGKNNIEVTKGLSSEIFLPLGVSLLFWIIYQWVLASRLEPLLMMASAKVAAFYRGIPALAAADHYWVLALSTFDLRVTSACSGVSFYGMLCTLALWLYVAEKHYLRSYRPLLTLPLYAFGFTVLLNAIRIHLAGETFFWFQNLLSEGWQMRVHLALGILIFLPALIFWFFIHAKKWTSHE